MKKRNQANQLARECIVTALIQLASQKPFSSITVSELTQKAGVSRMTYYRNYSSKEEVFQQYLTEIVEAYSKDVCCQKKPGTFGEYENILHCFRYFKAYQDFISCLLKVGLGNLLLEALSRYLICSYYKDTQESTELYYTLHAYAGALFGVYMTWLTRGMKESPEELAQILHHRIRSGI